MVEPKREPWLPFGKHKGETVKSVAREDPRYLEWLLQEDWFNGDKWINLYAEVEQALEDASRADEVEFDYEY